MRCRSGLALFTLTLLTAVTPGSVLLGCAGSRSHGALGAPDVSSPVDGTIEIRVRSGADAPRESIETRSLHAVVFADGSLHFALTDRGAGRVLTERAQRERTGPDGLPPRVRILSRQELARLWSEAKALGFLGESRETGARVSPGDTPRGEAPRDGTIIEGQFIAEGQSWTVATRATQATGTSLDPAITRFVRLVALLAWALEEEPATPIVAPRRYDLGPDPYGAR